MKQALRILCVTSLLAFAVFWYSRNESKAPQTAAPNALAEHPESTTTAVPSLVVSALSTSLTSSMASTDLTSVVPGASNDRSVRPETSAAWYRGLKDRQRVDQARAQLRAEPSAAPQAPATAGKDRYPDPSSSRNQAASERGRAIQRQISEQYFPMVGACYDAALKRNPGLAGKFALQFAIGGNAAVGGVVTEVSLRDDATLRDAELVECVKESLYGVFFEPPEVDGEELTVVYPLELGPTAP